MRFIGLFIAFPIAYLCVFSPQILVAWVGGQFSYLSEMITVMFTVQLAVCAVSALEVIPILFIKMRSITYLTVSMGAVNVILGIAAVMLLDMGTVGVAVMWTASMFILNVILYPCAIARMASLRWYTFLKPMIPGHVALAACLVMGWATTQFFILPTTWVAILGLFSVAYLVYLFIALPFGLKREDKDMIRKALPDSFARFIPRWML